MKQGRYKSVSFQGIMDPATLIKKHYYPQLFDWKFSLIDGNGQARQMRPGFCRRITVFLENPDRAFGEPVAPGCLKAMKTFVLNKSALVGKVIMNDSEYSEF
ncbi:MAG: hypothetical protein GY874_02040 [Desulfobacteraceae bacterium]|nr:hypothetical protein [Desulfobacteraceae bacterium]